MGNTRKSLTKKQSRILEILDKYETNGYSRCKYCILCAIVLKGKILCIGNNQDRSTLKHNQFGSMHAEIDALYKLYKTKPKCSKFDIWIIRRDKDSFGHSRPCQFCFKAMSKFPFRKVFYFNNNGELVSKKKNEMKHCVKDYYTKFQTRCMEHHKCHWDLFEKA